VYTPLAEIAPFAAPPATLHVTAVFVVPVTLAVNVCVVPTTTELVGGATLIATAVGAAECDDDDAQPARVHAQTRPTKIDAFRILLPSRRGGSLSGDTNERWLAAAIPIKLDCLSGERDALLACPQPYLPEQRERRCI
jgi:hypothetical protein